jgi:hypothetical protein
MTKQSTTKASTNKLKDSQSQAAAYISDLLQELEQIAGRERIEPLDQFLKIAREEAGRISKAA